MKFSPLLIAGAWLVEQEPHADARGSFARSFCRREFAARGLNPEVAQCNVSRNRQRGTLRGMHLQRPPAAEAKLVRCTRGAIYDVVLDLRPGSPTYRRWQALELDARTGAALYIPEGCAHGFQSLEDESEVFYQMSAPHEPSLSHGVRYDDPAFGIAWPILPAIVSERDLSFPLVGQPC